MEHIYLIYIMSAIGGILAYSNKILPAELAKEGDHFTKFFRFVTHIGTSIFTGYIGYLIISHFTESIQLSIAVSGVSGYAGVEMLNVIQDKLFNFISNKKV